MRLLTSESVTLRPVEPSDIELLLRWENDTSEWHTTSTVAPYSRTLIEEYVSNYRADLFGERQLRLMVTLNGSGETVGTIDLYDFDPLNRRAMIGIYIDPTHRRHDIALEALDILARYAGRHVGMLQLAASVSADNTASRHLFTSAGYTHTATLPHWYVRSEGMVDALIFQLDLK